ncbi:MAG: putative peptidase [Prokaryotic dsDNA virus sp.]|nr:MAG: putative peptidase [Prokaryotic dsDNA virus sp.]
MKNNLLLDTMRIQTESYKSHRMETFIKKKVKTMGLDYTTDKYGNIYVAKGDADLYPTMVCHIDTVHTINNNVQLVKIDDKLLAIDRTNCQRYGIGGDDKVGVYITLSLLQYYDNFKAVFFKDEEVGCKGSSQADFSFFSDSNVVLECDRRGIGDFVTSISGIKLSDDIFQESISSILTKYNRKCCAGGITDVGEIAEKTNVQVANMSCGYYDPHSDNEYIVVSEVEATKQMCIEIFDKVNQDGLRYEINGNRISYTPAVYGGFGYGRGYDYYDDFYYGEDVGTSQSTVDVNRQPVGTCKLDTICPNCGAHEVWYEEYDDVCFCMSCQTSVEIDYDDFIVDEKHMETIPIDDLYEVEDKIIDTVNQEFNGNCWYDDNDNKLKKL